MRAMLRIKRRWIFSLDLSPIHAISFKLNDIESYFFMTNEHTNMLEMYLQSFRVIFLSPKIAQPATASSALFKSRLHNERVSIRPSPKGEVK